jgi:predicted site-specific integrase-resolvase
VVRREEKRMPIDGYWNTEQMGAYHGVTAQAASKWCSKGWLPAVQVCTRGPWVAKIEDVKAFTPPRIGHVWTPVPDGYWTVAQITERYNVTRSAVSFWIKHRGLKAKKSPHGRWLIRAEDMKAFAKRKRKGSRLHETV